MLKVLHIYKTYYPDTFGGIEQVIYQLSEAGYKNGIESTVFSLSKKKSVDHMQLGNHTVYYARTNFEIASTPFSIYAITKFKELVKSADIIHYHFPYPYMDLLHFICGVKKPTVVSYHSDIVKQKTALKIYQPLMHRFLNSVDRIIASSPNYAKTSSILQRYIDKVAVIPYGLERSSYPVPSEEKLLYWKSLFKDKFFLFVGAFRYYKGLHILLDAAKNNDFNVVIVGSGDAENELKSLAQKLVLKNVHFVGAVSDEDKSALLTLCYCVVFPSHLRSEAFGISLAEGAMYGKPLISAEIGTGTSFINIHNETGVVVERNNPQALQDAMFKLISEPELAKHYGSNAYQRYLNFFTAEHMIEKYSAVYHELLSEATL